MRKLHWLVIAFFFSFFGCTKIETTNIGSGLIPPIDGVTTLDTTLDVYTNNYIDNISELTKVYKQDDHVIGIINNDPLFGKTSAKAYFELKPTSYPVSLPGGSSLVANFVVLILSYKGQYGDTTLPQNWEVRELEERMKNNSNYAVKTSFETGELLGSKTIDIRKFRDSVKNPYENSNNQIRIKLSSAFANRLMKQYNSLPGNAYQNDSIFRQNFRGFAVTPAAGSPGNALIRINLLDTNTKLALCYKFKSSESKTDTGVTYFRFSTGNLSTVPVSGSANYIKRDYTASQFKSFIDNNSANDSLLFIHTAPEHLLP